MVEGKKLKGIEILHFSESTEIGIRTQQASILIEFEGEKPKLIQGTQILKGDVHVKHTISYTIFDGEIFGKATYSLETQSQKEEKIELKIVGITDGQIYRGGNKPVDITIEVSSKTFSIIDPSILCDICQAIVKQICEELADEIPSDEICADICVAGAGDICLVFVETIVGYLICLSICAGLCAAAIEVATDYGFGLGAAYLCQKLNVC